MSPRRATHFSLLRQRKVSKRKATLLSVTPALRSGATCDARAGGAPWNSLRAGALRSDNHGKPEHEACVSFGTHAHPLRCASRHGQKGTHRTATRAIAALGPERRWRFAPRAPGRAQRWPVWFSTPCGCACGGVVVGWHARRSAHASSTDSPWLFERSAPARSEFHGAPRKRTGAGLPLRNAKGSQTEGRLSFGYFSLAKQRTSTSPAGARPGLRPQSRHAENYQKDSCQRNTRKR